MILHEKGVAAQGGYEDMTRVAEYQRARSVHGAVNDAIRIL
jgi:hypothetical protein